MKLKIVFIFFLFKASILNSQNLDNYYKFTNRADSFYNIKKYKNSCIAYSTAFKENGWKAYIIDRYNAACSCALSNFKDTAFYNLNKIAFVGKYKKYEHVINDSDLFSLHNDKRWQLIIQQVKNNKDTADKFLNKPVCKILDTIFKDDQEDRKQIDNYILKYGINSSEVLSLYKTIDTKDILNTKKVVKIIDNYGWLGVNDIGSEGNTTLFLVIQHSDKATQEKYLPILKEAVKNKKAEPSQLALLEDRLSIEDGGKQIYGSQIGGSKGSYYLLPLKDPDNVDKRRLEVGLSSLTEYLMLWQLKWDLEEYKKNNP